MRIRMLNETHGLRTWVVVFDTGDDVVPQLQTLAREHRLSAASFTGIGAFQDVTLGYFNLDTREYERIPMHEQVEVLSLAGNVARADGEPKVHAHVVVGRRDGTAHGGHLLEARVRPTLELVITETDRTLQRTIDKVTGLPLIDREAPSS